MFEVVFDYGEHDADAPKPDDAGQWTYRDDPFSSYRAGFEVRTSRLCQRVLMFHHFADEAGRRQRLPRALHRLHLFPRARPRQRPQPRLHLPARRHPDPATSRNNGGYLKRSLPPVEFEYTQPIVQDTVQEVDAAEPGEPARSGSTARPTSGPICTAKASPASSPSRPAPGSTSATSARSATAATSERSSRPLELRRRQTQPRPGRRAGAVHGPGRRRPARSGGAGWPHARPLRARRR